MAQTFQQIVQEADRAMGRTVVPDKGGTGSGFVLSRVPGKSEFYYLTNDHVIRGGRKFYVGFLYDGEVVLYRGRIAHQSEQLDLAVLRIEKLGNSDHQPMFLAVAEREILKGEPVAALGYPGSADSTNDGSEDPAFYASTLTQGAVSKRSLGSFNKTGRELEIIQHTASVNLGNSGGPLLDLCGSVVGVNTVISVWNTDGQTPTNNTFWASSSNTVARFLSDVGVPFSSATSACTSSGSSAGPGLGVSQTNLKWVFLTGGILILASLAGVVVYTATNKKPQVSARSRSRLSSSFPKKNQAILGLSLNGTQQNLTSAQLKAGVGIGRSSKNLLRSEHDKLSREHAMLTLTGRKLMLTDLGSSNGSAVDGVKLSPRVAVQVNTTSKIHLGGIPLILRKP